MNVKLIWITPNAERVIAYCARVSNPSGQEKEEIEGLLRYCVKHGHWSIFEMANMCLEITTSRAISQQIVRHRSFSFQEFSQRYAEVQAFEPVNPRRQDEKNRQSSHDDLDMGTKNWFLDKMHELEWLAKEAYKNAIQNGVAKESARFLLPLSAQTRLYMNGTIRSWIHYIKLREGHGTQIEHREIAVKCGEIFKEQLPIIWKALE